MIKLIVFLSKKFKFIDVFIKQLFLKYEAQGILKMNKNEIEEVSKKHLQLINEYENLGKASGIPAPKIYKQPKEG